MSRKDMWTGEPSEARSLFSGGEQVEVVLLRHTLFLVGVGLGLPASEQDALRIRDAAPTDMETGGSTVTELDNASCISEKYRKFVAPAPERLTLS